MRKRERFYSPERYACDLGHILYSDNVIIDSRGYMHCIACRQIRDDAERATRRKVS